MEVRTDSKGEYGRWKDAERSSDHSEDVWGEGGDGTARERGERVCV